MGWVASWITVPLLITSQTRAIPIFTSQQQKHAYQFTVNDCAGASGKNTVINKYSGTAELNCEKARIFSPPIDVLAQVVSIPDHHPLQMTNCLVKIDIFTGTCGTNTVLNRRNFAKINQLIFSGIYSPTPQACSEALNTGSLTWQTPRSGSYPGQIVTTALQDNFAQGHVYPYGSLEDIKCSGVFWVSPSGSGLFNAVLDIRYQLTVQNVWANVHLRSGR